MTLAPAFLDELRARVAVSTVVARRVKLSRAGREMKGCCPFHNEKSPSFFVNDDKGFYHCFGCGAHGDVIRFVVEQEGLGVGLLWCASPGPPLTPPASGRGTKWRFPRNGWMNCARVSRFRA